MSPRALFRRLAALLPAAAVTLGSAQECTFETFTSILADDPEASINFAVPVPAGGSFSQGSADVAYPANATQLPALRAVGINVRSSESSFYNFGLFLPDTTWNGRFMAGGNGGLNGGINWQDIGRMSQYGFATMSTDTGHNSSQGDGSWALNRPETVIDWAHRAMHGSVVLSKHVIAAYYSSDIKYSYYASCSTGGRQGLKEIQLHPESFGGISVGAPAWWTTHLSAATLYSGLLNYPKTKPEYISNQLLSAVTAEMIKQCDPQDGVVDQIVSDPFGCNFDYEALLCRGGANSASPCLTPGQLETVYKAYSDWVDANQTYVFPGLALGADSSFLLGSVNSLGYDLYRYFVYNSSTWDYTRFTYEDVLFADTVDPGDAAADDFDLSPYHRRGGKILKYHGGADSLIPTGSSVHFRKRVEQTLAPMGVDLDDFYRFFLVPDMGHCSGSARGPWYISAGQQSVRGATHSVPGFEDEEHDAILALMAWVEGGTAPEKIIATKFVGDDAAAGVQSQRPLCPYPKQAKYISGDVDAPGSWECQSLY